MVKWLIDIIFPAIFFAGCLFAAGCESASVSDEKLSGDDKDFNVSVCTDYVPVKVVIMPLSECIGSGDEQEQKINIYVSLHDSFGSQMKAPAVFRFELYEKVPRSSEPKGKRIFIWPDINLTDPDDNNKYWRDFLRGYEFNLDFESERREDYIIQVTCQCPDGKRLSAQRDI